MTIYDKIFKILATYYEYGWEYNSCTSTGGQSSHDLSDTTDIDI